MSITHIVALSDQDSAIGKDNEIPWHIPEDLKHFKNYTMNKQVFMGYNTYLSILPYSKKGLFLEGRDIVVVCSTVEKTKERSRQAENSFTNVTFKSIADVRKIVLSSKEEVIIAGGNALYDEFPPDKVVATLVQHTVKNADTFYSFNLNSQQFVLQSKSAVSINSKIPFSICIYQKVSVKPTNTNYLKYEDNLGFNLLNKVDLRLNSYDNVISEILEEFKDDVAIAGGAIRAIASNTPIKDIDFYVTDICVAVELKNFLVERDSEVICSTDNAYTLKTSNGKIFQIIFKIFLDNSNPTSLTDSFDFTITKAIYFQGVLYLHNYFLEHIAAKTLVVDGTLEYPISTLVRSLKYQEYGYTASSMFMVNIALQIHSLTLYTYADLKEQLQGIDTQIFDAYFDDKNMTLKFSISDFLKEVSDNYFKYLGK